MIVSNSPISRSTSGQQLHSPLTHYSTRGLLTPQQNSPPPSHIFNIFSANEKSHVQGGTPGHLTGGQVTPGHLTGGHPAHHLMSSSSSGGQGTHGPAQGYQEYTQNSSSTSVQAPSQKQQISPEYAISNSTTSSGNVSFRVSNRTMGTAGDGPAPPPAPAPLNWNGVNPNQWTPEQVSFSYLLLIIT
jgi:hypothetical protein